MPMARSSRRRWPPDSRPTRWPSCGVRPTRLDDLLDGAAGAVAGAVDADGLADRQLVLDPGRLQHDADAVAEVPPGRAGIVTEDGHVTGGPRAVALEDLDRGRLAGPVVAEQGVDLTLGDLEREAVDAFSRRSASSGHGC